jgi:multiple sugar transport system ATP-binding protein
MAQISCVNLSKSYGSVEVIPDFNLDVADHEFVVFLGPSGCGKSTILRMIAGLEDISGGTLLIDGKIVNDLPPRERNIAMVFQSYALYPHMSVFDNIAFGLWRMKIGRVDIARRVTAVAAMLGLETLLERRPEQLSGGQQQRVAIARAMIKTPQVFLFDEPLSNLDAKLRGHMRIEIARLHKKLKTTTIYVTHDQLEAMTLADRIVVLRSGVVEQIGSPAEIYQRPRTLFVAGFIGSPNMNLIDVTVADGGDRWILSSGSGASDFTVSRACFDLEVGAKVVLGIRPSDMTIVDSEQPGNVVEGKVELVEFLGNEVLIDLTLSGAGNGGRTIAVLAPPPGPVPGATLRVALDEQRLHLFDAESGLSLLNEASVSPANLLSSGSSAYARAG